MVVQALDHVPRAGGIRSPPCVGLAARRSKAVDRDTAKVTFDILRPGVNSGDIAATFRERKRHEAGPAFLSDRSSSARRKEREWRQQ